MCSVPRVRSSISQYSRLISEGTQKDKTVEDTGKWRGPIIELSIGSHVHSRSAVGFDMTNVLPSAIRGGAEGGRPRTPLPAVCYEELAPTTPPLADLINNWHSQHISAHVEDLMLSQETMELAKAR